MTKTWTAALTISLLLPALIAGAALGQQNGDTSAAPDTGSRGAEIIKLLDEGMNHYRLGEYDEAAEIFGKIMAMDPDNELALVMRQRAGTSALLKMLNNKDLAPHAQDILRKSQKALEAQRRSAEEIRKLIDQFNSDKLVERWRAERLIVAVGSVAVPYLLDYLDVERDVARGMTRAERVTARAHAQQAIVEMGTRAVLPLVEALNTTSTGLKIEACRLLAKVGDERAVPRLLRVKEEAGGDNRRVVNAAQTALEEIAQRTRARIDRSAVRAYFALAESYYYGDPRIIDYVPSLRRILWDYTPQAEGEAYEERIVYTEVPQYAYNEMMAEKLVCEGLGIHDADALPEYLIDARRREPGDPVRDLLALLAANNYAQLIETRALAAGRPVTADLQVPDEVIAQADERAQKLEDIHLTNRLIGSPALHDALGRHLRDNDNAPALECIADLRALKDTTIPNEQNALHQAMRVPNRAVRYTATEALLHLAPSGHMGACEMAIANVISACSRQTLPNVGVVTGERALFAVLADAMSRVALPSERLDNVRATLSRTRHQMPFISVLVVDTRALEMSLETSIDTLRKDAVTQFMPIVLLTPADNVAKARTLLGDKVAEIVSLGAKAENVVQAVQAALQKPTEAADSTTLARARLVNLLNAVAALPAATAYPINGAAAPIAALLEKHPDSVRIPAASALAAIGAPGALHTLLDLYLQPGTDETLRVAAGHAAVAALRTPAEAAPRMTDEERSTALKIAQGGEASEELRAIAVRLFSILVPERSDNAAPGKATETATAPTSPK